MKSGTKRGLLRWAKSEAEKAGKTLLEQLEFYSAQRAADVSTGQLVSSTSKEGFSVSFSIPGSGAETVPAMAAFWEDMIDLYEAAQTYLGGTPTDDQILAQMLTYLPTVRSCRVQLTSMYTSQ